MPTKPKRPCPKPGCPNLECTEHTNYASKQYDRYRGTAASRGYDSRWATFSRSYRARHPLCAVAKRNSRTEAPNDLHVDHIIPLSHWRGSKFDGANLQAISAKAHARKTRDEYHGNNRGAPLAGWPLVPWRDDLTLDEAHRYIELNVAGSPLTF